MRRRLTGRKGLTLVEMLISIAVLVIFVSIAAVGTSMLFGSGEQMEVASKASVLGADVMELAVGEVRFGRNFSGGGDAVQYDSASYGENCTMTVREGKLVVSKPSASGNAAEDASYLLVDGAQYGGAVIQSVRFTLNVDGSVEISVEIGDGDGTPLWQNGVTVVPLDRKLTS